MSEIRKAFSVLFLSTPNAAITLQALFIRSDSFISTLDIDYTGLLSNFPNFSSLNVESKIIAHISETSLNILSSQIQGHPSTQIICSSQEDSHTSIFVIISKLNPFISSEVFHYSHILLKFSLEELHGKGKQGTLAHIENINNSINSIKNKNIELYSRIQETRQGNSDRSMKMSLLEQRVRALNADLESYTRSIINLHQDFEKLEKEEDNRGVRLRCIMCENNLKNVVFLPCGHLLICQECLFHNLKTEPNCTLERRRKLITCQNCKTKVRETRTVAFQ